MHTTLFATEFTSAPKQYVFQKYQKKQYLSRNAIELESKLDYWMSKRPDGFYKFIEPCNHRGYRLGDSLVEETLLSRRQISKAFQEIGVSYKSRTQYEDALLSGDDIFQGKKYAKVYDRGQNKTWFYQNEKLYGVHSADELGAVNNPLGIDFSDHQQDTLQSQEFDEIHSPDELMPKLKMYGNTFFLVHQENVLQAKAPSPTSNKEQSLLHEHFIPQSKIKCNTNFINKKNFIKFTFEREKSMENDPECRYHRQKVPLPYIIYTDNTSNTPTTARARNFYYQNLMMVIPCKLSEEMVDIWYEYIGSNKPYELDRKRIQFLRSAYQKLGSSMENWREFCRTITTSRFLMGEIPNKPWKIYLDWAIQFDKLKLINEESGFVFGDRKPYEPPKIQTGNLKPTGTATNENKALEAFKEKCLKVFPEATYKSWIEPMRIRVEEGDKLILEPPTAFVGNWVKQHHEQNLQMVLNMFEGKFTELKVLAVDGSREINLKYLEPKEPAESKDYEPSLDERPVKEPSIKEIREALASLKSNQTRGRTNGLRRIGEFV